MEKNKEKKGKIIRKNSFCCLMCEQDHFMTTPNERTEKIVLMISIKLENATTTGSILTSSENWPMNP